MSDDLIDKITSEIQDVISKNVDEFLKEIQDDSEVFIGCGGLITIHGENFRKDVFLKDLVKEYLENVKGDDEKECYQQLAKSLELEVKRIRKYISKNYK